MMSIEEMNSIRQELGLTYQKICQESGVPIGTVQKVLGGITKNPRMETMRALEESLGAMKRTYDKYHMDKGKEVSRTTGRINESGNNLYDTYSVNSGNSSEKGIDAVREDRAVYGAGYGEKGGKTGQGSGHYVDGTAAVKEPDLVTVADREALPDWRRTELVDGVLYDMASPSMPHQDICGAIYRQLEDCIRKHHSQCHVFIAPADVCLDEDDYTMVQPDVFIVCDRKQITRKNIQGAPAFILEVLSPSNRVMDKKIKMVKYLNAGVREYWMIDPDSRQIIVFDMTGKATAAEDGHDVYDTDPYSISIYGFSDQIPLAISGGKCVIDMNPIRQMLDELYPAET